MGQEAGSIELIARGLAMRGEQVLLCRSVRHGYSYLPGGHVEFGEGAAAACEREFLEETGLTVKAGPLLLVAECRFVQNGRERHELNLVFHVEHQSGAWADHVESRERKIDFLWAKPQELRTHDFRPHVIRAWLEDQDGRGGGAAWLTAEESE